VWNDRLPGATLLSLGVAWLTLVSALLFWSLAPVLVGWHPRVVLTGSMAPALRPGDVVLVAPAPPSIPPGRVALVPDPARAGQTYLHRVVRVDEQGVMTTQGDANPTPDSTPVPAGGTLGELRLVIPTVGRPVIWAREHRTAPLLGVGVLTLGSLALILFQDVRFGGPATRSTAARPRRFRT
jgi:signal peptidase